MIKKILIFLLIVLFVGLLLIFLPRKIKNNITEEKSISPTTGIGSPAPTYAQPTVTTYSDYNVSFIIIRDMNKLSLRSNLEDKLSATDLSKKYSCNQLTSGGFYTEDDKHIGLFISDSKTISETIQSDLFNAVLYVNKEGKSQIANTLTDTSGVTLALQSGPLLIKNSTPLKLKIDRDENARRIVAGITKKRETVFLALYYKASPLSGPKLAELPEILDKIQNNTNLKFDTALNLDGGSHSAFFSDEVKLGEISRIGSFFCIKY